MARDRGTKQMIDREAAISDQFAKMLQQVAVAAAPKDQFKDVQIVRDGSQITVPRGMAWGEAHRWLERQEKAEETDVALNIQFPCFPLDGAYALALALHELYGFTELMVTPPKSMFDAEEPPQMVAIDVDYGKTVHIPWGSMRPVGIVGRLETAVNVALGQQPRFVLTGVVKKKSEAAVKAIEAAVRKNLIERSIYRAKSISLDLGWMHDQRRFDPLAHAPKFMDVSGVHRDDLIVGPEVQFALMESVFSRLERSDAMRANGVPLKHGVQLIGPYGCGKTLAARCIARVANDNGWTFLYVQNAKDFSQAIRYAALYAPCVLFCEDVDRLAKLGKRTDKVNDVFNTLDGIDTKSLPIISILTTNRPDDIHPAFLRAGRIDSLVEMGPPDEETAERFIRHYARDSYGKDLLKPGEDLSEARKAMSGLIPSFIAEACHKARISAIYREGDNIVGKVTAKDLVAAAHYTKRHSEMVDQAEKRLRVHEEAQRRADLKNGVEEDEEDEE